MRLLISGSWVRAPRWEKNALFAFLLIARSLSLSHTVALKKPLVFSFGCILYRVSCFNYTHTLQLDRRLARGVILPFIPCFFTTPPTIYFQDLLINTPLIGPKLPVLLVLQESYLFYRVGLVPQASKSLEAIRKSGQWRLTRNEGSQLYLYSFRRGSSGSELVDLGINWLWAGWSGYQLVLS